MPAVPFRLLFFSLYGDDIIVEATPATILLDLRPQLVRKLPRIDWDSVVLYLGAEELSWNDTVANQRLTDGVRILIGFRDYYTDVADRMLSQQSAVDYVSETESDATHHMTISQHDDDVSNNYCAETTDQDEEIRVSAGTERDTSSLAAVDREIVTQGLPDEVDHIRVRQAFVDDEDDQTADQQQHGTPHYLEETTSNFERPRSNEHCKHVIVTHIDGNTSQTDHETSLSNDTVTPEQCEVANEWMEYSDSTNNDGDEHVIREPQEYESLTSDFAGERNDDNTIEESRECGSLMSHFDGERSDNDSNMIEECEEYASLTSAFTEGRNDTGQHDSESGVASGATDVQVLVSTQAIARISSGVEVDCVDQDQLPVMPHSLDTRVGSSSTQEEMDLH